MASDILVPVVTSVLSGGLGAFVLGVYQSRKQEPGMRAEVERVANESDSLQVESMRMALEVSQTRVRSLEDTVTFKDRQILDKDIHINEQEARINQLQRQVAGMQSTLSAMATELDALRTTIRPDPA